jgi:hypothetical protein
MCNLKAGIRVFNNCYSSQCMIKYSLAHYISTYLSLTLSLAPQPSLGLGLLHKIRLNFLEASQQFSFSQVRVVRPTPNPHPGGPGLCIYIPRGRMATHFSRLLRHAWVTVGLFLFSGHHTGNINISYSKNARSCKFMELPRRYFNTLHSITRDRPTEKLRNN